VRSRTALAFCLSWQGEFTEAITLIQEATYIAEAADHQGSVVNALQSAGLVYALKGDYEEAISQLERGLAMGKANQMAPSPAGLSFLAHIYALAGRVAEALPLFEESLKWAAVDLAT
jgi:tetratricopeptide (TPR) repeat protein